MPFHSWISWDNMQSRMCKIEASARKERNWVRRRKLDKPRPQMFHFQLNSSVEKLYRVLCNSQLVILEDGLWKTKHNNLSSCVWNCFCKYSWPPKQCSLLTGGCYSEVALLELRTGTYKSGRCRGHYLDLVVSTGFWKYIGVKLL